MVETESEIQASDDVTLEQYLKNWCGQIMSDQIHIPKTVQKQLQKFKNPNKRRVIENLQQLSQKEG